MHAQDIVGLEADNHSTAYSGDHNADSEDSEGAVGGHIGEVAYNGNVNQSAKDLNRTDEQRDYSNANATTDNNDNQTQDVNICYLLVNYFFPGASACLMIFGFLFIFTYLPY